MRYLVIFSLLTTLLIAFISAAPTEPKKPTPNNPRIDRTKPYNPLDISSTDIGPQAADLDLSEFSRTRQWKLRRSYMMKQSVLLAELREQHPNNWPSEEAMAEKQQELSRYLETLTATARRNQKNRSGGTLQQKLKLQIRAKQKELKVANERAKNFEERHKMWAQRAAVTAENVKRLQEQLERLRYPRGRQGGEVKEEGKGGGGDVTGEGNSATDVPDRAESNKNNNNMLSSLESLPLAQQASKFLGNRVDSFVRTAGKALQDQNQRRTPSVNVPGQLLGPVRMPAGGVLAY